MWAISQNRTRARSNKKGFMWFADIYATTKENNWRGFLRAIVPLYFICQLTKLIQTKFK